VKCEIQGAFSERLMSLPPEGRKRKGRLRATPREAASTTLAKKKGGRPQRGKRKGKRSFILETCIFWGGKGDHCRQQVGFFGSNTSLWGGGSFRGEGFSPQTHSGGEGRLILPTRHLRPSKKEGKDENSQLKRPVLGGRKKTR